MRSPSPVPVTRRYAAGPGIARGPLIDLVPAVPALEGPWAAGPGPVPGQQPTRARHGPEPLQSPCPRARRLARHAGRRQRPVRIYRSQVTPPAAPAPLLVLQRWSAWQDLRGAGRDRRIPAGPGLYCIRRAGGEPGLDYVGQTGRSLPGRLGQFGGVYRAQMPYRDPHTAAPALWALRHRDGCDFEVAVIEAPGTAAERKALEAAAITLYRLGSGRSPAASFGRMPAGYRISSGNNARLAAAGRSRQRAGQRAAVKPQVITGAPPGTRTPNPRIKSPLLRSSIQAIYQHLYASTLARYPQPAEAEYRMRTVDTGLYRDIRANMEQTWKTEGLDHYGKWSLQADGRYARRGPELWPETRLNGGHDP